jgi:hypothetical protein
MPNFYTQDNTRKQAAFERQLPTPRPEQCQDSYLLKCSRCYYRHTCLKSATLPRLQD